MKCCRICGSISILGEKEGICQMAESSTFCGYDGRNTDAQICKTVFADDSGFPDIDHICSLPIGLKIVTILAVKTAYSLGKYKG